jgi:hypothetical protein
VCPSVLLCAWKSLRFKFDTNPNRFVIHKKNSKLEKVS